MSIDEVELKDEERQPCEIWTRVMGYHRPVSEFNKGKKEEFAERKYFTEKNAIHRMEDMNCISKMEITTLAAE